MVVADFVLGVRHFIKAAVLLLLCLSPALVGAQALPTPSDSETPTYRLSEDLLKKVEIEILSTFRGYSFDERQDKSQIVQMFVQPKLRMNLHPDFSLRALGSMSLGTARVQTRFDDPSFNYLNLNELVLAYAPNNYFQLEVGALDQDQLRNPMLLNWRSFPGAMVISEWKTSENSHLSLKAQYSIPNSTSLESDRTDNEELPSFITQGFEFFWQPQSWLKINSYVHHFTYNNLPSVVAFQSGRLGNEVVGENSSESYFAYGFDGFTQSYQVDVEYSKRFSQSFNLQTIDNLEAPSDRSRSQWTGTTFDIHFKDFILSPQIAYFYAESDSAPALYSATQLGRNNRRGLFYGLKMNFKTLGFVVSANYVQAKLIELDPIQNDLNAFEFLVELPSVKF